MYKQQKQLIDEAIIILSKLSRELRQSRNPSLLQRARFTEQKIDSLHNLREILDYDHIIAEGRTTNV
jgi:hypothetical protein